MAVNYNPKIVRNKLSLCLDAANPKSYSGSGSTWSDISGNGNHATLTGNSSNVTYNSAGYFTHNPGNTYFGATSSSTSASSNSDGGYWAITDDFTLRGEDGSWTIGGWAKPNGDQSGNGGGWFHKAGGVGGDERCIMAEFIDGNFRVNGQSGWSAINHNVDNSGVWQYITVTYKTDGIYGSDGGTLKLYIDGSLEVTVTGFYPSTHASNAQVWLGKRQGHNQHFFKGDLAVYHFYQRELSASEVLQNFEALRGRFGV